MKHFLVSRFNDIYRKSAFSQNMADENDVLDSWEELDDKEVLDKKLESITIEQKKESKPVTILQEEGSRTQYTPQVRILKRENNSDRAENQKTRVNSTPQKTLEQREAEYKEARLRILGENYSTEDNVNNSAAASETKPIKLVKSIEDLKLHNSAQKVQILREPRAPDGSGGFEPR